MKHLRLLPIALLAAATLAACGGSSGSSSYSSTTAKPVATTAKAATTSAPAASGAGAATTAASGGASATTAAAASGTATLQLADIAGHKVLTNSAGKAVYLYTKDSGGTSACSGGCATAWPVVSVTGKPVGGPGLDQEDLATINRPDGTVQVTFYGHPLYLFAGDTKAGEANGQGSGSVWYLVGPDGNAVK